MLLTPTLRMLTPDPLGIDRKLCSHIVIQHSGHASLSKRKGIRVGIIRVIFLDGFDRLADLTAIGSA
jgi:hypothetical protein